MKARAKSEKTNRLGELRRTRLGRDASPYLKAKRRRAGFTLIEMIGVLAIMAILATVLVPNVLHSIEMAAIKAEGTNLQNLGESVKLYLRTNRVLPGSGTAPATASWSNDLASFADLAPADVLTTTRQQARVFVTEPTVVPPTRALLISSMRTGINVPAAGTLNTLALFNNVWNTTDGSAPTGAPWTTNGWNATTAQYLTIRRINLQAINATDLQGLTVLVNNSQAGSIVSYHLISGITGGFIASNNSISPGPPVTIPVLVHPRDRLDLYTGVNYGTLAYSYIFSANNTNALTFTYQDSVPAGSPYWRPQ